MKITTDRSKVKIERFGAIGYIINFGVNQVQGFFGPETKTYVLDSKLEDLFDDGSSTIQLWEKNNLPLVSANKRCFLLKIKKIKYEIKNWPNVKRIKPKK